MDNIFLPVFPQQFTFKYLFLIICYTNFHIFEFFYKQASVELMRPFLFFLRSN